MEIKFQNKSEENLFMGCLTVLVLAAIIGIYGLSLAFLYEILLPYLYK